MVCLKHVPLPLRVLVHKQNNKSKKVRAVTLVELLIVIVIIGIIASIALIRYGTVLENARMAEAYAVLTEIVAAEKRHYLDSDPPSYTATITALDSFETAPASDNFTFTVPSTNATTGYAQAARTLATGGRRSYGMCLDSGDRAGCDADACNPGCP